MKYLKLFETYEEEKLDSYSEYHKFTSRLTELFNVLGLKFRTVIETDDVKTYHCVANFDMNLNEVKYSIVWILLKSFPYFSKATHDESKVLFVSLNVPYNALGQIQAIVCDEDVKINQSGKYTIHPKSAEEAFNLLIELPKNYLDKLSDTKLQIDGTYVYTEDEIYHDHVFLKTIFAVIKIFIDANNKLDGGSINIPTTILDAIIDALSKTSKQHEILNQIKDNNPILYSKFSSYNNSTEISSALGGIGF